MSAELVHQNGNEVTVQFTVHLTGSMLDDEQALQQSLNEAGQVAMRPMPDESQFYRFLKNTKNSTLKAVHKITDAARSRVPRDSKEFKDTFKHRQTAEQYFSRLGDREAEQTTHYGFTAISNQMTIAHLTASLIAVAAGIHLKQPDKIRYYQTFADPPDLRRTG